MDYTKRPGKKIEKIREVKNEEKPTITIITPFYNGGKTLMETANAVFNQTYPFFEWVIVDDGSKDKESLKKLAELETMDKRIHVYHKKNEGPSLARDYAIEKSNRNTKYIFNLDCDDIPDKKMLEVLYWTLETHPEASFAYTAMINFGDKEFIWEKYLTIEQEKFENLICTSSMIKKDDLLEVGCYGIKEKSMYEDWNLWLKLIAKGKKPIRVNAPLFWYRFSNSGEFSRANKNKENAMRYVNETADTIDEEVEVIQFPREGNKYAKVKKYNMTLPMYKDNKKKKILFLFPWMTVGGADLFNLELIKRLNKEKYEVIVLTTTPEENPLCQQFEEYAEVYDMATFLDRQDYIQFADYIIESRNINMVVVSNTPYGYYMVPYLKGKYPKIPFIDYIHSIDLNDPREAFGRCTMDVDKYLTKTYCCNNFTKNQLIKNYNKTNVETLYIGTDAKKFDPKNYDKEQLKEKYEVPQNKKIITFIARLADEKRPLMFIEIAKKLLESDKNLYFLIAGDGALKTKVQSKVDNNFKLLGMVKKTEEVYAISDITINCSSLEGLALTSYESLAMKVPNISSDVGGQAELIDDSVGGIVHYNENANKEVFNEEINDYVQNVKRVLENLDKIKGNCRKKIEKDFTLDLMAKKFEKIVNDSIAKEKDAKVTNNDYIEYELAIECLHKVYYYHCKKYIENKYDIIYANDQERKNVKWSKRKKKINRFLINHYARNEAMVIVDWLRSIKRLLKEIILSIKFLIKSIPATFKLIYKIIFK